MKKMLLSLAASGLLFFPAMAEAKGITGLWNTGSEGGKVEIYRCGQAFCGKVVAAERLRANPDLRDVRNSDAKLRSRPLKCLVVLKGFRGGPKVWSGGPVYDPETGDGARSGKLTLLSNGNLQVKGCVMMFCRTKTWTRAD